MNQTNTIATDNIQDKIFTLRGYQEQGKANKTRESLFALAKNFL